MQVRITTGGIMKTIREKHHRLPEEYYRGYRIVSFTCRVRDCAKPFTITDIFFRFEEMLLEAIEKHRCDAFVYLFMPDHAHLLLAPQDDCGEVLKAMRLFKQKSGFWLSKHRRNVKWQKDFYDHILRHEEDIEKHVRYILANPIRAGLVEDWKEYTFRGSTVFDLDSWTTI
jgi:REP element-mobilizing transposase RayT